MRTRRVFDFVVDELINTRVLLPPRKKDLEAKKMIVIQKDKGMASGANCTLLVNSINNAKAMLAVFGYLGLEVADWVVKGDDGSWFLRHKIDKMMLEKIAKLLKKYYNLTLNPEKSKIHTDNTTQRTFAGYKF
uniref:RdRp n=1 Tax=viral metagenome TaxID=1070528 RepID=A0A2V0R8Z9_9ZZZZ